MNAGILVKLPQIPLLANEKSQGAHGISSLSFSLAIDRLNCVSETTSTIHWECSRTSLVSESDMHYVGWSGFSCN